MARKGYSLLYLVGWGCEKPVRFSYSRGQSLVVQKVGRLSCLDHVQKSMMDIRVNLNTVSNNKLKAKTLDGEVKQSTDSNLG